MTQMCSCLCVGKWSGGVVICLHVGGPTQTCMPISSCCIYTCAHECVCVCGDVALGLLWSSPCLISMSIDSICFAHERARMCRRTGERKNEGCGGGPGTAVYLSPPCRNLYRTLSALIKDHSVGLSLSSLAFSPLCSLFLFLTHTHILRYTHKWKDWHVCKYTVRTLPLIFMLAPYTLVISQCLLGDIQMCTTVGGKVQKKHYSIKAIVNICEFTLNLMFSASDSCEVHQCQHSPLSFCMHVFKVMITPMAGLRAQAISKCCEVNTDKQTLTEVYRDTTWAVAPAAERRREGDEMWGRGVRDTERGLRGGQTAGLFLPDEQITHSITALSFYLHLLRHWCSQSPLFSLYSQLVGLQALK